MLLSLVFYSENGCGPLNIKLLWGNFNDIMAKVLNCCPKVSKFKLKSHYYIHFQSNILGRLSTPLPQPAMG